MADNIKIVGNINSTSTLSRYSIKDTNLIPSNKLQENFGGENDYIEFYIYDIGGNILNTNYNYLNYKLPANTNLTPGTTSSTNTTGNIQTENVGVVSTLSTPTSSLYPIIEIDPIQDLQNSGYSSGEFIIQYNLFQNKISSYLNKELFIKEISSDRTEIRLASITLTDDEIESTVTALIDKINNSLYYVDYLLNFGNNKQYVAINIALNKASEGYEILFKLYEPLPLSVQEKQTLWVVEERVSPYIFNINLDKLITLPPPPQLKSANFNIEIPNNGTVSTGYNTYSNLVNNLQSLQNTSYKQILNLLTTQSVDINVDYTDFNDFIFFGSAYQRTSNFYTKIKQIEDYNNLITTYSPLSSSQPSLIIEINLYSSSINTIVSQFDGYESYLYFESSSYAWPKLNSTKPFSLLSTGSLITKTWYNTLTGSAQTYDLNNYDNLEYAIPVYLKDDTNNAPFLTFLNMVGHYFDNIWIYIKAITDINLANNNLEEGISKDLVYERLKSLGVHLYNSQAGEDVSQFLIGSNTGSSIFPFTPISGNDFTVTGSFLNNIPRKDLVSELYKRIYHNLPLLLKTKGTVAGLNNLLTVFGIPNQIYYTITSGSISSSFYTPTGSSSTGSILNVKEFGGSLKSDLIKGYNNDKVRIISNTITGSVLSPILSLQTFPTNSNDFRENDSHYIDVSFSPQTQIDTYISRSIASNNSTWSLDDFIGDPRQQYSGSYPDLDAQRRLYFETGVPGFAPFTGSLMDYNGFIRLIQYFDNALFKMLDDFVPERASLSTGVTISSPVLERNKAVYANPTNTTTQSVVTGTITTSSISSQYGNFYNALSSSNNTMGWFDGELSGSIVNINQYFTDNYNPYLQPTGTIDQNQFVHSDWNVLLNNVSQSVISRQRKKIEYTGNLFPSQSITSSVELQDSYLTLRSYNTSRYEGSKTISLKYNTYSTGSNIEKSPPITIRGALAKEFTWLSLPPGVNTGTYFPSNTYNGQRYSTFFTDYTPGTPFYILFNKFIADPNPIKQFRVTGPGLGIDSSKIFTVKTYSRYYYSSGVLSNLFAIAISEDLRTFTNLPTVIQDTVVPPDSDPLWISNLQFEIIYSDSSYGKTAAIDRQSYKVGWVKNIPSASLNFSDKTQIQLKYLVDKAQNITDLTLKNNNLTEVQNTFKSGDNVVLSLSDAIKPSFQKTLDGTKSIFRGGYSYDPILFRESNEALTFRIFQDSTTTSNPGSKRISQIGLFGYNSTSIYVTSIRKNLDASPASQLVPREIERGISDGWISLIDYGSSNYFDRNAGPMATAISYDIYNSNYSATLSTFPGTKYAFTNSNIKRYDLSQNAIRQASINFLTTNEFTPVRSITATYSSQNNNYYYYNVTFPEAGVYSFGFESWAKKAYFFDGFKFEDSSSILAISQERTYNTEPTDTTAGGTVLFNTPRTSTYLIKLNLPVALQWSMYDYVDKNAYNASQLSGKVAPPTGDGSTDRLVSDLAKNCLTPFGKLGFAIKLFGILEKQNSDQTDWNPISYTTISPILQEPNSSIPQVEPSTNIIYFPPAGVGQFDNQNQRVYQQQFNMVLNKIFQVGSSTSDSITLDLNTGDKLRFRVVLLDLDQVFNYGEDFQISFGKVPITGNNTYPAGNISRTTWNATPYPSVEIKDTLTTITNTNNLRTLGAQQLFTVFNAQGNQIVFSDSISDIIKSGSIFVPQSPTSNLYSEVIDYTTVQAQDLIRIGSITEPYPQYYTVISASVSPGDIIQTSFTINNGKFRKVVTGNGGYNLPNNTFINQSVIEILDGNNNNLRNFFNTLQLSSNRQFQLLGTGNTNIDNYVFTMQGNYSSITVNTVQGIAIPVTIYGNPIPTLSDYSFTGTNTSVIQIVPFSNNIYAILDRNINSNTSNLSSNFAILRPKPDETSVIINFKKLLGDVSQTILIPQDANDEIKASVGTIFQSLNVDLSNQTQTNTP